MKLIIYFLAVIGLFQRCSSQPISTDNILELHDTTFDDYIRREPSVMVLFYAPWCHWCNEFLPRYKQAANLIVSQNVPVKLVQIDASKYRVIADSNGITGYPTLTLYLDSQAHPYDGEFATSEVVKWLVNHLQTEVIVSSNDQLDTFIGSHKENPILMAHFDSEKHPTHRETFIRLSRHLEGVEFAEINNDTVKDRLVQIYDAPVSIKTSNEFLVMLNPHYDRHPSIEQRTLLYPGVLEDYPTLEAFIKKYFFPALMQFSADVAPRVFKDGRPIFVLFTNDDNKSVVEKTVQLGSKFRGDLIFMQANGHGVVERRLQTLLGVENEKFPTVRIFRSNPDGHATWHSTLKYRPSLEVLESYNLKDLDAFITQFKNNQLKPFMKSEPEPEDNSDPVKILVASQWDDLVINSKNDVLVEFHAPWCGHCHKFSPTYNKVGEHFQRVPHVDVMKIDATQNEVNVQLWGYPQLILFTHKENEVQKHYYEGERLVEDIVRWVAQLSTKQIDVDFVLKEIEASDETARQKLQMGDAADWILEEL